jgi:putative endonuclease
MSNTKFGATGEDIAATYLEKLGYRILERNYRFEKAEVDLICFEPAEIYEQGGELVFVEVKTRKGIGFGLPEEAVTTEKQRNVIKAAKAFLYERHMEGSPCRFDVVGILFKNGQPKIEHFKNAFWSF